MTLTLERPPAPPPSRPATSTATAEVAPARRRLVADPFGVAGTQPVRAAIVLALFLALAGGGLVWHASGPFMVTVNGRPTRVEWRVATLAHALHAAGIEVHDGVLYAARSGRVLDMQAHPARIERNGAPATRHDRIRHGDAITVVNGVDRVEEVDERSIAVAPTGLPVVETHLWRDDPGWIFERTGRHSGEVLERRVLSEASPATPDTRRVVALTFDDGPDPRWTPAVLETLAAEGVAATFCVVGSLVRRYPDLTRAIAEAGHTLCNHTDNHVVHLGVHPPTEIAAEIRTATEAISEATGHTPAFYRAPGGTLTPGVIEEAQRQGLRVLSWSVDPFDWRRPGAGVITDRVMAGTGPGGIVLLHDGGGDRSQTVGQLRELIQGLRAQGYQFDVPGGGVAPRPA